MVGALLIVAVAAALAVLFFVGWSILLVLPAGLALVAAAIGLPVFMGRIAAGRPGGGVPSTEDASYDPVASPPERP